MSLQQAEVAAAKAREAPAPAAGSDPMIGKSLEGRFVLEAVLGRGAMGVVYRASQTTVGRPVAVKVLRKELSADPVLVGRFLREVRVLSLMQHPNLLTIHDFGQDEQGRLYVATELLEGQTVGELSAECGRLDETVVLDLLRQVAEGLLAAHEKGVVHRDIKPENLFLVPVGRGRHLVKVLDFGIAWVDETGKDRLTHLGGTVGTPAYMSPEQIRGDSLDPRSDLYSLGCVAYKLLTGRLPFSATSVARLALAHLTKQPPQPREFVAITPAISDLVMRLLSKERDDRSASAEAFLEEVEGLLHERSGSMTPPSQPTVAGRESGPHEVAGMLLEAGEDSPTLVNQPASLATLDEEIETSPSIPSFDGPPAAQIATDLHLEVPDHPDDTLRVPMPGGRRALLAVAALVVLGGAGAAAWLLWSPEGSGDRTVIEPTRVGPASAELVWVRSDPPGAAVLRLAADGTTEPLGETPLRVPRGTVVRLARVGYTAASRDLTAGVTGGEILVRLVRLVRAAPATDAGADSGGPGDAAGAAPPAAPPGEEAAPAPPPAPEKKRKPKKRRRKGKKRAKKPAAKRTPPRLVKDR